MTEYHPFTCGPCASESWLTDAIRARLRDDEVRADIWRSEHPRWWNLLRDTAMDWRLRIYRFDPSFTAESLSEGERERFVVRTSNATRLVWMATGHECELDGDPVDVLDEAAMFVCLMLRGHTAGFKGPQVYAWIDPGMARH